jgi:hypothetical protein
VLAAAISSPAIACARRLGWNPSHANRSGSGRACRARNGVLHVRCAALTTKPAGSPAEPIKPNDILAHSTADMNTGKIAGEPESRRQDFFIRLARTTEDLHGLVLEKAESQKVLPMSRNVRRSTVLLFRFEVQGQVFYEHSNTKTWF